MIISFIAKKEEKMSLKFDHLGIVVKDIEEAANLYHEILGLTPWSMGVKEDSANGVRLLSLPTGDTFIELIQPVSSNNRFARFLRERGGGLFHLCFFADDFDKEVRALKEKGFTVEVETASIDPEHPFRLAWLPPESTPGVWIELADMAALPEGLRHHKF
jgi:methylmalonyl-CoA epimerase